MTRPNARGPSRERSASTATPSRADAATGFVAELFRGVFRWDLLHPYAEQDPADRRVGDEYIARLKKVIEEYIDPEEVDRTGDVPQEALLALAEMGCFGLRIPTKYGGLGMSQTNYSRIMGYVWSFCSSTATWLMAHQSSGLPEPLLEFGTEAQRDAYLPRIARGSVTALAFTEPFAGSDPLHTQTTATPTEDGEAFVIQGEKLWCTNGPSAELVLVVAATPHLAGGDRSRPELSAFILESDAPGLEVTHYCSFVGNRGISSGVLRFTAVKAPAGAMLGQPGDGLRVLETALTASRITLPATSAAVGKVCAHFAKSWCNERDQGGAPIGKHLAVAEKVSHIVLDTFVMESMNAALCAMADQRKGDRWTDAAVAKYYTSEAAWRAADEFVQIRGGRGLETAESLARRGEDPVPAERMLRDARINRVREGTTEVLRARVAQSVIEAYLTRLNQAETKGKGRRYAAKRTLRQYAWRLPTHWLPDFRNADNVRHLFSKNKGHLRYAAHTAKRLSIALAHATACHQERLEREYILVRALVDIAAELFAMGAVLARTEHLLERRTCAAQPLQALADAFCVGARERIEASFRALTRRDSRLVGRISNAFLNGEYDWLEEGVYTDFPPQFVSAAGLRHPEEAFRPPEETEEEAEAALLEEMADEEAAYAEETASPQDERAEEGGEEEAVAAAEPEDEPEAKAGIAELPEGPTETTAEQPTLDDQPLSESATVIEEAAQEAEAEAERESTEAQEEAEPPAEPSEETEAAPTARG